MILEAITSILSGERGKKKKEKIKLFLSLSLASFLSFFSRVYHSVIVNYYQQPLVKSVKRDTASRGGQNKYGHGSSVTRDQRIFTLDERNHWRRKSGNIWVAGNQDPDETRNRETRNGTKVEGEN